jgi:predicted enzyme related to lactoylglutathione lyase
VTRLLIRDAARLPPGSHRSGRDRSSRQRRAGTTDARLTGARGVSRFGPVREEMTMGNPICHWELMVNDLNKAQGFYQRVFAWKLDTSRPEYTMIDTGSSPGGGMMLRPPAAPTAALNTYFAVVDIDATLRQVVEAGGTVAVPRTEVPAAGWFAMFLDPDNIPVGIFQELAPAATGGDGGTR